MNATHLLLSLLMTLRNGNPILRFSLSRLVNWTHVVGTYLPVLLTLGIFVLIGLLVWQVVTDIIEKAGGEFEFSTETVFTVATAFRDLIFRVYEQVINLRGEAIFSPAVEAAAVVLVVMAWILHYEHPIYLLSFATFKAPTAGKCRRTRSSK